jgi:hypothetical protein
MRKTMEVWGTQSIKIHVDPCDVVKNINVLPNGAEWIKVEEKDGKKVYSLYEEVSAGTHSFDSKIGETTKEIYDLWKAQRLLLSHLEIERNKQFK